MERVLILGCSGAGKTVLARRLAEATALPVIHLDRHYWRPGWVAPDKRTWTAQVDVLVQESRWIMDGNYGGTLKARLAAADTAIFLDFPTWICLGRILRRTARSFGRTRGEDVAADCPERLDWPFLQFVWRYRRVNRPLVLEALASFEGRSVVLRGPGAVRRFLRQIEPTP